MLPKILETLRLWRQFKNFCTDKTKTKILKFYKDKKIYLTFKRTMNESRNNLNHNYF